MPAPDGPAPTSGNPASRLRFLEAGAQERGPRARGGSEVWIRVPPRAFLASGPESNDLADLRRISTSDLFLRG